VCLFGVRVAQGVLINNHLSLCLCLCPCVPCPCPCPCLGLGLGLGQCFSYTSDDVTYVYDDVTYVYDDVTYVWSWSMFLFLPPSLSPSLCLAGALARPLSVPILLHIFWCSTVPIYWYSLLFQCPFVGTLYPFSAHLLIRFQCPFVGTLYSFSAHLLVRFTLSVPICWYVLPFQCPFVGTLSVPIYWYSLLFQCPFIGTLYPFSAHLLVLCNTLQCSRIGTPKAHGP